MTGLREKREVVICNQRGLHARAAARFVKLAEQFEAEVWGERDGQSVSGRSIMGLMMLAAGPGSPILLSASGRDAQAAIAALARLVESTFHED